MCPPNPARFLLRFRGCVALSRAVAPAVADRVAEQKRKIPAKSTLLRCCGSGGWRAIGESAAGLLQRCGGGQPAVTADRNDLAVMQPLAQDRDHYVVPRSYNVTARFRGSLRDMETLF